jgi:hypothetical protein
VVHVVDVRQILILTLQAFKNSSLYFLGLTDLWAATQNKNVLSLLVLWLLGYQSQSGCAARDNGVKKKGLDHHHDQM